MSKSLPKTEDFVFDDDTDDSDDDLEEFRSAIVKVSGSNATTGNTAESSGEDEDLEEEEGESQGESDEESSEGSDESESEESESEKAERERANSVINNKLGKLSSLLSKDEESSESEPEEEDSSDNSDDEDSSIKTSAVINNDQTVTESSANEKKTDKNYSEKDNKGNITDDVKKRKIDDVETEVISLEEEREKYRSKLSKLSVQEILKIKENLGDKMFNSKWSGKPEKTHKAVDAIVGIKRENKNRPREISSKIKPRKNPRIKPIVREAKRDPRFDPLCGEFDKKEFSHRYGFLNDVKSNELVQLKEQLKETSGEEAGKIKYLVQRMENQFRAKKDLEEKEKKTKEERLELREKIVKGEKPMYKNKRTIREEKLVNKYEDLKKTGGVDKYIKKMSKKNTFKDRKLFGDIV